MENNGVEHFHCIFSSINNYYYLRIISFHFYEKPERDGLIRNIPYRKSDLGSGRMNIVPYEEVLIQK